MKIVILLTRRYTEQKKLIIRISEDFLLKPDILPTENLVLYMLYGSLILTT